MQIVDLLRQTLQNKVSVHDLKALNINGFDYDNAFKEDPTFRTPNCHRGKLRREKTKVSIKINIESEKRHLKNSKSLKMSSNLILNKEQ